MNGENVKEKEYRLDVRKLQFVCVYMRVYVCVCVWQWMQVASVCMYVCDNVYK